MHSMLTSDKKTNDFIRAKIYCVGELTPFGALSRKRLNPIKLVNITQIGRVAGSLVAEGQAPRHLKWRYPSVP